MTIVSAWQAFVLAGTKGEVTKHLIALREAGIDSLIVHPLPGEGVPLEDTIAALGEIWPGVVATAT